MGNAIKDAARSAVSGITDEALRAMVRRPLSRETLTEKLDEMLVRAPHEVLADCGAPDFVRFERALYNHCLYVQQNVLATILQRSRDTEFGRAHHFGGIHTIEDFRAQVPLSDYGDYATDIKRMEDGEPDVLFPGRATFFFFTSGTTGALKYVPESPAEAAARKVLTKARYQEMALMSSTKCFRRVFGFYNRSEGELTAGGIPAGTASGRTAQMSTGSAPFAYAPRVVEELEGEALYYTIMRLAMAHADVSAILGNNAHMMTMLVELAQERGRDIIFDIRHGTNCYPLSEALRAEEDGALTPNPRRADELERLLESGRLTPRHFWPDLVVASLWLGGSVGVYVDELRPLLGEHTTFIDVGYGASEAKINIPMRPETSSAPLSVTTSFFEFIPASGGEPLLAHELADGETYEIVLTTYGGLYRYRLKDYVRVDGFTGTTPNICFVSKVGDVANLAQEKIAGVVLLSAVRDYTERARLGFVGCQVFADAGRRCYVFCVETRGDANDAATFSEGLEAHLLETIPAYRYCRIDLAQLRPCEACFMDHGWWDRLVDRHRKHNSTAAQVKVPVVVDAMPEV